MDVSKIYEEGKELRTYRRIEPSYKANIFLGYNESGNMSLVIIGDHSYMEIKSTKFINISLTRRNDSKYALTFDLLDDRFETMFYIFTNDIINYCEGNDKDNTIPNAVKRWKYWKALFGNNLPSLLSINEVKGLIGELFFLKNYIMKMYGDELAINSWMGPELGHKDFELNDSWYEVKTVSEGAIQVGINSIEQLDSEFVGHLIVVRMEKSGLFVEGGITLNRLVESISSQIEDIELFSLFFEKLSGIGYRYSVEYDKYVFLFKGMEAYMINDQFPRIRKEQLPTAVSNVKYTLLLDLISCFREDITIGY